jgi:transcriptional regulator with XRE-family HTH domain
MRNDLYLKKMGQKIKAARKENKISLPKMSDLCGVDMSNLWFLEIGQRNPHLLTLKNIADVLNKDVKDFI